MFFRIITTSAALLLLLSTAHAQTARGNRGNRTPADPRGKARFPSDTMGFSSSQLPAGSVRFGSPEYYRDSASLNGRAPMQQQYNAGQYQRESTAGTTGRTGINTADPAGTQPTGNQPGSSATQQQQPSGISVGAGSGVQRPADVGVPPAGTTGSMPADARNQPSGLNAPAGDPTTQPTGSQRPGSVTSPNPDGTPSPANPTGTGVPGTRPAPSPVDSNRTPRQ